VTVQRRLQGEATEISASEFYILLESPGELCCREAMQLYVKFHSQCLCVLGGAFSAARAMLTPERKLPVST
jgi:hypothetical protein